jgi:hypothetical protein
MIIQAYKHSFVTEQQVMMITQLEHHPFATIDHSDHLRVNVGMNRVHNIHNDYESTHRYTIGFR